MRTLSRVQGQNLQAAPCLKLFDFTGPKKVSIEAVEIWGMIWQPESHPSYLTDNSKYLPIIHSSSTASFGGGKKGRLLRWPGSDQEVVPSPSGLAPDRRRQTKRTVTNDPVKWTHNTHPLHLLHKKMRLHRPMHYYIKKP